MSVASLTVDQREKRSYLNLIALGSDATLSDLEVAADMATCTVSFRRFAREELTSTEPAPEIIPGSLSIQRETQFQRQRYNRQTICRQLNSDGTARMANVGFIGRIRSLYNRSGVTSDISRDRPHSSWMRKRKRRRQVFFKLPSFLMRLFR